MVTDSAAWQAAPEWRVDPDDGAWELFYTEGAPDVGDRWDDVVPQAWVVCSSIWQRSFLRAVYVEALLGWAACEAEAWATLDYLARNKHLRVPMGWQPLLRDLGLWR